MARTTDLKTGTDETGSGSGAGEAPTLTDNTRTHLGVELRSIYAELCETQPITDAQVDLLLRLRHKERDRRRAA